MTNTNRAKLYSKMARVMNKVERVPKNGYNNFHKYEYSTEADVIDSVRKFLAEEGLVLFNSVENYEIDGDIATVSVEFTLCCADTGEEVKSIIVGQGSDKGDKAFYKAYSGATKYYLMKTFLIPSGDDPEADVRTDERAAQSKKQYNNNNQYNNSNQFKKTVKPISDSQLRLIHNRMKELSELSGKEVDAIKESLKKNEDIKQKVGSFESFKDLSSKSASAIIDKLISWEEETRDRLGKEG